MSSTWILWISTCYEALGATEENPTAALLMIDATPELTLQDVGVANRKANVFYSQTSVIELDMLIRQMGPALSPPPRRS